MTELDDEHVSFRLLQMQSEKRTAYLDMWKRINNLEPTSGETVLIVKTELPRIPSLDGPVEGVSSTTYRVVRGDWPFLVKFPEQILGLREVFLIEITGVGLGDSYNIKVLAWSYPRISIRCERTGVWQSISSVTEIMRLDTADELSSGIIVAGHASGQLLRATRLSLWATNLCPEVSIGFIGINCFDLPYVFFSCGRVAELYARSLRAEMNRRGIKQCGFSKDK